MHNLCIYNIYTHTHIYIWQRLKNIGLVTGPVGLFATRLVTESGGLATNPSCDKPSEDYSTLHRGPRQGFVPEGPRQKCVTEGGGGDRDKPLFRVTAIYICKSKEAFNKRASELDPPPHRFSCCLLRPHGIFAAACAACSCRTRVGGSCRALYPKCCLFIMLCFSEYWCLIVLVMVVGLLLQPPPLLRLPLLLLLILERGSDNTAPA